METSADSNEIHGTKSRARSRISNGTKLLAEIDGRTAWARRMRDLIGLHLSDLGGYTNVSEAERSLVRRAAALTVELERLEGKFAVAGEACADDLEIYQRCANSLRRLLESVGLQRRAKVVDGLTLSDLIRADQQAQQLELQREREHEDMPS